MKTQNRSGNMTTKKITTTSLVLLASLLTLTACTNENEQALNTRIEELTERNTNDTNRLYHIEFEVESPTEITMTKHFLIDFTDEFLIDALNAEELITGAPTEMDVAQLIWNASRQDYQHEANLFHFYTDVAEFILNVRYLNVDGTELISGSFTYPQRLDEAWILEELAIDFPEHMFVVTERETTGYDVTCVATEVTFNTIGSQFNLLRSLYLEALWRDFVATWRRSTSDEIAQILNPIYEAELTFSSSSGAFIYGSLESRHLEPRHFDVLYDLLASGTDFENLTQTFVNHRSELPISSLVRLRIGYTVNVDVIDFEGENERLRAIFQALGDLELVIPVEVGVTFIQADSYMVYRFSLSMGDLAEEDLATYDFTQHFIENRDWHCPYDMDRGLMCPPEVDAYFESLDN